MCSGPRCCYGQYKPSLGSVMELSSEPTCDAAGSQNIRGPGVRPVNFAPCGNVSVAAPAGRTHSTCFTDPLRSFRKGGGLISIAEDKASEGDCRLPQATAGDCTCT